MNTILPHSLEHLITSSLHSMNRTDQCYQCYIDVTPGTINFAWCPCCCRSQKYRVCVKLWWLVWLRSASWKAVTLLYHIQHIQRNWRASKTVIFCFIDVVKWKSQSHYFRFGEYYEATRNKCEKLTSRHGQKRKCFAILSGTNQFVIMWNCIELISWN